MLFQCSECELLNYLQAIRLSSKNGGTRNLLELGFLASWDDPDAETECFWSVGLCPSPIVNNRIKVSQKIHEKVIRIQ